MQTVLAIRQESLSHITYVVRALQRVIANSFGSCSIAVADRVDQIEIEPDSLVFVIGERYQRFSRCPGAIYIYLNFSVIEVLGSPLATSPSGWRQVRQKSDLLRRKLDLFDIVLDYYPPQTEILRRKLSIPVFGFPVVVDPSDLQTPPAPPIYDVCFVGRINPRRDAILDGFRNNGSCLSPNSGVVFEELAAQSRTTLNIHALRSNHLESPRFIGAFAAGSPVISEPSFGLETIVPDGLVTIAPPHRLARETARLLDAPNALAALAERATDWYQTRYLPECEVAWERLADQIDGLITLRRNSRRLASPM